MAAPTIYNRSYSFTGYQAANPKAPLPGPQVDNELDDVAASLASTQAALADIRRSDGNLANGIVTPDSLSSDALSYITATAEGVGQIFTYRFTATAGQTVFSGVDIAGAVLASKAGGTFVLLNGVELAPTTDYSFSADGSTLTLTSAASADDRVVIHAYDIMAFTAFGQVITDQATAAAENASQTQYARFETVVDMLAAAPNMEAKYAALGSFGVTVLGGRAVGDGGMAEMIVTARTGSETTYTQNGLTCAPGFEIMISAAIKAIWPTHVVNAVTVGARNDAFATQAQSIAANDALFGKLDELLADTYTIKFPPGTFWHRDTAGLMNNKNSCGVVGSGIDVTVINQANFLDGSGNPQYDDGTGTAPNPLISSAAAISFQGGSDNRLAHFTYNARWMRMRGLRLRDSYGVIEWCKVTETTGRAFGLSNAVGADVGTLDPAYCFMTIRHCIAIRSVGTAISLYGNTRGKVLHNIVNTCWAEGITTDVSDGCLVEGNHVSDVCRTDDAAGYPPAGLWDTISGNGGIGAIGAASCDNIIIRGNYFSGIGQDNAADTSRDRPFIRWRPNKKNNTSCIITDNHFENGHNGIHIETMYNDTDAGYIGLHSCTLAVIEGNTFRNIHTNSGQGHIRIDEGCTYIRVGLNACDTQPMKIFGAHDVSALDTDGVLYNGNKYIDATCDITPPTIIWGRTKADNGADLAGQTNVTGNYTPVVVTYPLPESWNANEPAYAAGTWTLDYDGLYEITAAVEVDNATGATSGQIDLQVNGVAKSRRYFSIDPATATACLSIHALIKAQSGDTVNVAINVGGIGADTADLQAKPLVGEFFGRLIR